MSFPFRGQRARGLMRERLPVFWLLFSLQRYARDNHSTWELIIRQSGRPTANRVRVWCGHFEIKHALRGSGTQQRVWRAKFLTPAHIARAFVRECVCTHARTHIRTLLSDRTKHTHTRAHADTLTRYMYTHAARTRPRLYIYSIIFIKKGFKKFAGCWLAEKFCVDSPIISHRANRKFVHRKCSRCNFGRSFGSVRFCWPAKVFPFFYGAHFP